MKALLVIIILLMVAFFVYYHQQNTPSQSDRMFKAVEAQKADTQRNVDAANEYIRLQQQQNP